MSRSLTFTMTISLLRMSERCLQAKEFSVMGAHGGKEPSAQTLQTPFAAAEEQSTLETPPQPVPLPSRMPRPPTPLSPMQNGMAAVTPQANGPAQQSLTPVVLRKLLLANGIPEGAAARGSERGATACTMAPHAAQGDILLHLGMAPEVSWEFLLANGIPARAVAKGTGAEMRLLLSLLPAKQPELSGEHSAAGLPEATPCKCRRLAHS